MEYLQYSIASKRIDELKKSNIVLNLIINGIPSIPTAIIDKDGSVIKEF